MEAVESGGAASAVSGIAEDDGVLQPPIDLKRMSISTLYS
jgi:hypothetical protein